MPSLPVRLALLAAIAAIGTALILPAEAPAPAAEPGAPMVQVTLPPGLSQEARTGQQVFDTACAACHGTNAAGRAGIGPPLVHKIYEPSHHADMAFVLAVRNGVVAHHWSFGNMPPQPGLTEAETQAVITYVRELQRANGIN